MLDLVLPERCAVCETPGHALCDTCRSAFTRLVPPVCERCGSPGPWPVRRCAECAGRRLAFANARAAIVYDARARAFVRGWKERGRRRLAREAAQLVAEVVPRPATASVAPVPGDPERAWHRGDVPSHALAVELGRIWSSPSSTCSATTGAATAARPVARGASSQRPRERRRARCRTRGGLRRRRRLHVRRHGGRMWVRLPTGRCPPSPGDHPRAGRPLD